MSHAVFAVTVTELEDGTHGALAAKFIVDTENEKRLAMEVPLPELPVTPWADLKASYLTVLTATLQSAHDSYIKQQGEAQAAEDELNVRWLEGGEAERTAALAALPDAPAHEEDHQE